MLSGFRGTALMMQLLLLAGAVVPATLAAPGAERKPGLPEPLPPRCLEETCSGQPLGIAAADSLSMLQRAAAERRHDDAASLASAGDPGLESPVPSKEIFKDVRMLYMKLRVSPRLNLFAAFGGLFGEPVAPAEGGIALDPSGAAHVMVSHFPDAPITWKGVPGESRLQNLPHHMLTVQVPVLYKGRKLYQTVYALANDDTAVKIWRLSVGLPAKLGNFSFPSGFDFPEAQGMKITRRGNKVLQVAPMRRVGPSNSGAPADLFDRPDILWGTHMRNFKGAASAIFHERATRAKVRGAQRLLTSVEVGGGPIELLEQVFEDNKVQEAWWLHLDLETTTSTVTHETGALPEVPGMLAAMRWRYGGETLTDKPRHPRIPYMAYQNGDIVWVNMKINKARAAPYLPPGFTFGGDEAVLWNVHWQPADIFHSWGIPAPMTVPLEYNELWVNFPVSYKGKFFWYPAVMLLDDDMAVMTGHDFMGCPKKLANMTFVMSSTPPAEGTRTLLQVGRKGRRVMELTGRLSSHTSERVPGVNDNLKDQGEVIFVVSAEFPRDVEQDVPYYAFLRPIERTWEQRALVDMRVSFGFEDQEPLGQWFEGEPTRGGYVRMDQDWSFAAEHPFQGDSPPAGEWLAWWKRTYQLNFM